MDDDGYLWYQGRADDVIKSAGYRIGPAEIETCLVKHPAVANAAVVRQARRDARHVVKAFIVLQPGTRRRRRSRRRSRSTCAALAPYEYPREIEFIDALPMTTTGKVQRKVLREREAARKAQSTMSAAATVTTTARLALAEFVPEDAAFVVRLVNDPDWIRYIGDRGVRTDDDARAYLERGPIAMYARHGFGLWRVARREDGEPVGMCGLIKRDTLPDVDVGFALLPEYRGMGLCGRGRSCGNGARVDALPPPRVVAIASPDNDRSLRLLTKLGMTPEGTTPGADPDDPTVLYARGLS